MIRPHYTQLHLSVIAFLYLPYSAQVTDDATINLLVSRSFWEILTI